MRVPTKIEVAGCVCELVHDKKPIDLCKSENDDVRGQRDTPVGAGMKRFFKDGGTDEWEVEDIRF